MEFCDWCDKEFDKKTSKQIYCSAECRDEASKVKIMERYFIEKRKKRKGKVRMCAGGCGTKLSMYNDESICDACMIHKKRLSSFMKEVTEFFDYDNH